MADHFIDLAALKRQRKRIAYKALTFIARDLQQKMRRRLKIQTKRQPHSKPGESPRIDTVNSPLKKLINYSIDRETDRVYVGPMKFRDSKAKTDSPIPNVLERGGREVVHVKEFRPSDLNRVSRRRPGKSWFTSSAKYKRAAQSERFKEWKRQHQPHEVNREVTIKSRPFVKVTLDEYIQSGGVEKAIRRAAGYK